MHHRDNPKGLFLWRAGDHVLTHGNEAQGPSGKVGASAADVGERDKRIDSVDSVDYFRNQLDGGFGVIRADEIPNLVKVTTDFRVEVIGNHSPGCVRRAALFSRKWATTSSREMGFILPLFRSS
ncbi:MAG TPA: hypothetical protein VG297_01750 [Bryobacteraceae bacterium]|nr:hypothetical protein [Bryobacteraceae bacterium]